MGMKGRSKASLWALFFRSGDPLVKLMCENEVPKGGPKRVQNVKKLIFGCPGGGAKKSIEKKMKMRSFREGKVVILHGDSWCILKIGPFRKVSPEARQKTSQIELILGQNFESVSKRGIPKKG